MGLLMGLSVVVFFISAWQLNGLALALAPVAAAYVVLYSYAKYYTWTSHFVLGWADAIAPAAAWIGVTGQLDPEAVLLAFAVATWIGGFDIIYSCADYDFDRQYGVHSIPRQFGIAAALWVTRGLHLLTAASLLALGLWLELDFLYYVGWGLAVALLIYENSLVKPNDLSRLDLAFFRINSYISVLLFVFTTLSVVV
jgi:4-hydroxybenzoate polyprenyltransferase